MTDEKTGEQKEAKADFLFEVSWEVCNKVGGINTVIKTKIPQTQKRYGKNYLLVGPYFHQRVKGIFEEGIIPEIYKQICEDLRGIGIVVHYGRWLTEGSPSTILLDFQPFFSRKDEIKKTLWEFAGIDSLHAGFEFDEPVVWSWAAGMAIERFSNMMPDKKTVALFHEWLSGAALLHLKWRKCRIGTVFVTHATVVGRSLANAGVDMYSRDSEGHSLLEKLDFDRESYNKNVHEKHQLEKASARFADVFATVSEITGMEAEHTLGKKPDVIVPNGIDLDNFPTMEENSIRHKIFREKIFHFLLYYFFPHYYVDIENTLIYFIASRYEFHDKGIDISIKALGRLNELMKKEESSSNIVVFFWVPSGIRGVKTELVENKMKFKDVEDTLKDNAEHVMWRLLSTFVADRPITKNAIFTQEFLNEIRSKVLKFKSDSPSPPICTHDLTNPYDPIINAFRENNLTNAEEDKVKVIYYPTYLNGADGLLDLTYYEAMQGSHFGIFPSFYEPWGYTPLEAGTLGVANVTSDLAGFGRYLQKHPSYKSSGIFVLDRMGKTDEDTVASLTKLLYYYLKLPKNGRIHNKLEARLLANLAGWDVLISNYIEAQNMATERAFGS